MLALAGEVLLGLAEPGALVEVIARAMAAARAGCAMLPGRQRNGPHAAARSLSSSAVSRPQADRCSIAATRPKRSPSIFSNASRLPRTAGSSALTSTWSKNASTCGRSLASPLSTPT